MLSEFRNLLREIGWSDARKWKVFNRKLDDLPLSFGFRQFKISIKMKLSIFRPWHPSVKPNKIKMRQLSVAKRRARENIFSTKMGKDEKWNCVGQNMFSKVLMEFSVVLLNTSAAVRLAIIDFALGLYFSGTPNRFHYFSFSLCFFLLLRAYLEAGGCRLPAHVNKGLHLAQKCSRSLMMTESKKENMQKKKLQVRIKLYIQTLLAPAAFTRTHTNRV